MPTDEISEWRKKPRNSIIKSNKYLKMQAERDNALELVDKRNKQMHAYHDMVRDPKYMVPLFTAIALTQESLSPNLEPQDFLVLIREQYSIFFKHASVKDRNVSRRLRKYGYLRPIKGIKGERNYCVSPDGRDLVIKLTSMVGTCFARLIKAWNAKGLFDTKGLH